MIDHDLKACVIHGESKQVFPSVLSSDYKAIIISPSKFLQYITQFEIVLKTS